MIPLLLGIAALLSLLLFVRFPSATDWIRVSLDASHGPIFAAVALLLAMLLSKRRRRAGRSAWPDWGLYLQVFVLSVAIGAFIEFLQGFEGRPPSFLDVVTDAAGAAIGLAAWTIATRPRGEASATWRSGGFGLVLLLATVGAVWVLWHPLQSAQAYAHRAAIFPVLAEFERPVDLRFVSSDGVGARLEELPAPWSRTPGERALAIGYDVARPPSLQILEPSHDWRGHDVIAVDVTNAGPADLAMVLRILDASHDWSHEDRLNLPVVVPARTRTTIRVTLDAVERAPASRRMDLGRIANVMLFGRRPAAPGTLYVSRLWLE